MPRQLLNMALRGVEKPVSTTQNSKKESSPDKMSQQKEEKIKMLSTVVCICNGVKLGQILKVLDKCDYVADVNMQAGTGSGGCAGERCGPRIKSLLKKNAERKNKKKEQNQIK